MSQRAREPSPPPLRTALIVGVDHAPGADPLPGSRADARTMQNALQLYGFEAPHITMLLEARATRGAIFHALDRLVAKSSADGITVVSFAAHSVQTPSGPTMRVWDGRIDAREIAWRLRMLRGRVWSVFATCYAGGYGRPGVVGADRIAVFSSSASRTSLQLGDAGSFLVLYMARYAMIDGGAPGSVEAAFRFAREGIARAHQRSIPIMDDGVTGDLVLGERQAVSRRTSVGPRPPGGRPEQTSPPGDETSGRDPLVRRILDRRPARR